MKNNAQKDAQLIFIMTSVVFWASQPKIISTWKKKVWKTDSTMDHNLY